MTPTPAPSLEGRAQPVTRHVLVTLGVAATALAILTSAWTAVSFGTTGAGRILPSDLFFISAAGVMLLASVHGARLRPPLPLWLIGSAGLCLLVGCLTILFPYSPHVTLPAATPRTVFVTPNTPTGTGSAADITGLAELLLAMLVVPVVVAAAGVTPRAVATLAKLWVLSASVSALVALSDRFGVTSIGELLRGAEGSRVAGLAFHPNQLGILSAIALPVACWFATRARGAPRLAYIAGAAVLLAAIIQSGSRAAFIAAILSLLYLALVQPPLRRPLVLLAVLAGVATAILPTTEGDTTALERFGSSSRSAQESDVTRALLAEQALDDIVARPLIGTGFHAVDGAHSIYLQLLQAGGVAALLAFGIFVVGAVRVALRLSRHASLTAWRHLARAFAASLGALLVGGTFTNYLTGRGLYIGVGLILALSSACSADARSAPGVQHARS